ncbi:hypothetical protein D3C83_139430 [compost metagenome]
MSRKKRPNGGEPVMITVASTNRALVTGARVNVPCPIRSKFEELCSCASVPAEKSATGFASE